MLKIAHIAILIILTAVLLAGCTGTTNTPTPSPTVTAVPPSPSVSPSVTPSDQASSSVTPTPAAVSPNRTTKVQVRTITTVGYVEFKVYTDKVIVTYLSGLGNLSVNSSNMGGSGLQSGYLREPGDNITLGYNSTMPGIEQNASIFVYQPTDNGMTYGGSTYYPGTGNAKEE